MAKKGHIPWNKGTEKTVTLTCVKCGKTFQRTLWHAQHAVNHYCSRKCAWMKWEGKRLPPEMVHSMIINHAHLKGENSPVWQGGRYVDSKGYVRIRVGDEYIHEHRLVMEKHLGRKLTTDEVVHHINGNRQDNRLENLELTNLSDHAKTHKLGC
jgi:hypothetical protein